MRSRARRSLIVRLACVLLLLATTAGGAGLTGQVTRVDDGDTLTVAGIGKVRLLGIDVPEHLDSPRDRFYRDLFALPPERLRAVATAARAFTREHAAGQLVRLEPGPVPRDRYERLLAYLLLPDGRMLNLLLLEEGLASAYRKYDHPRREEFLAAEARARAQRRGLWAEIPQP